MLFRSHFNSLCFFATGYVKDFGNAREIVQASFVALWEKRQSIDPAKSVRSYLTTSVRNRCINYLRDHKKYSHDLLLLEEAGYQKEKSESDKLVEKELEKKIASAIGELPEKCREIFLLSRHENLRYQQIADRLKISVKTVETQMSKALQHMRLRLAEYLTMLFLILFQI